MNSALDRWTIILVPAMASLGALLLGLGQQTLALPLVVVFCAIAAAICTDYLNWFHLPRWLANTLASSAVLFGFYRFSVAEPARQLFVIADLLLYLQIVLFFQEKRPRVYWHICLLSFLQVVVSAALNLYVAFGGLMIIYLFLALGCTTLLYLREEIEWHRSTATRLGARSLSTGAQSARAYRLQFTSPRREPSATTSLATDAIVSPALRHDVDRALNLSLTWQITRFGLLTLALTCLIFFLTPRFGKSAWQAAQKNTTRLVGYSGTVSLNELGPILESPEEVMRVQFTHEVSGEPFTMNREPYLRGEVLADYRPVAGTWLPRMTLPVLQELPPPPKGQGSLVRQTVLLESDGPLFSVLPVYLSEPTSVELSIDRDRNLLVRPSLPGVDDDGKRGVRRRYEVLTSAFRFGMQRPVIPASHRRLGRRETRRLAQLDRPQFPTLCQVAAAVLDRAGVSADNRVAAARMLESHLRSSSYKYTLNLTHQPPPGVDPIEHFVAQHHEGHCEYFASALALMCRSQGIPSRLVLGYRGGDYNRVGEYYLVRQLHAHAWVEVYLEPSQVPQLAVLDSESTRAGAWLRLDPTPGAVLDPMPVTGSGWLGKLDQLRDFLELLWRDYVVGLDSERQMEAIYKPLADSTAATFRDALFNPEWWSAFGETLSQRIGLGSWETFRDRWLDWRTLPILLVMGVAGYVGAWGTRWGWKRLPKLMRTRSNRVRPSWNRSRQLDFFSRWERLATKLNVQRSTGQTHQEMASVVAEKLGPYSKEANVRQMTYRMVGAFYRVRFGKQRLEARELVTLDGILRQLSHVASDRLKLK